jgi:hypothetical protein
MLLLQLGTAASIDLIHAYQDAWQVAEQLQSCITLPGNGVPRYGALLAVKCIIIQQ